MVISPEMLAQVVDRIVVAVDPDGVILFGSQARGTATAASDVDLLVIHKGPHLHQIQMQAYKALMGRKIAVDVLVRSPEDLAQRLAWHDPFVRDIVAEGKVIYEKRGSRGMAIFSKA